MVGIATLKAVKSFAITNTPRPIATRASRVLRSIPPFASVHAESLSGSRVRVDPRASPAQPGASTSNSAGSASGPYAETMTARTPQLGHCTPSTIASSAGSVMPSKRNVCVTTSRSGSCVAPHDGAVHTAVADPEIVGVPERFELSHRVEHGLGRVHHRQRMATARRVRPSLRYAPERRTMGVFARGCAGGPAGRIVDGRALHRRARARHVGGGRAHARSRRRAPGHVGARHTVAPHRRAGHDGRHGRGHAADGPRQPDRRPPDLPARTSAFRRRGRARLPAGEGRAALVRRGDAAPRG